MDSTSCELLCPGNNDSTGLEYVGSTDVDKARCDLLAYKEAPERGGWDGLAPGANADELYRAYGVVWDPT